MTKIMGNRSVKIYFTDFFGITDDVLEDYGAFNISLINDIPLFIDPFLLFNSNKKEYQELHDGIIKYLDFLKQKSTNKNLSTGTLLSLYKFSEIKENWLGYSENGNGGRGLGKNFALSLHNNLNTIFSNTGNGGISKSAHFEKVCLIDAGIGKDQISDLTTNLIHDYLLKFTQTFATTKLNQKHLKKFNIPRVRFNYYTETWESDSYILPDFNGSHVIICPKDILTKDEIWINKFDMYRNYHDVLKTIENEVLRSNINNYFLKRLEELNKEADKNRNLVINEIVKMFPEFLDYFVRYKEDNGKKAEVLSQTKVALVEEQFRKNLDPLTEKLYQLGFYKLNPGTLNEAINRAEYLKDVIENNDGYKIFYNKGKLSVNEKLLHVLYRLTWFASEYEFDSEVNNGRGPVDFKISAGSKDRCIVEFKLASNSKLSSVFKQIDIYGKANKTEKKVIVIFFFDEQQQKKVTDLLNKNSNRTDVKLILIDASSNKKSASLV